MARYIKYLYYVKVFITISIISIVSSSVTSIVIITYYKENNDSNIYKKKIESYIAEMSELLSSGISQKDLKSIQTKVGKNIKLMESNDYNVPEEIYEFHDGMESARLIWNITQGYKCEYFHSRRELCIEAVSEHIDKIGGNVENVSESEDIVRKALSALNKKLDSAMASLKR